MQLSVLTQSWQSRRDELFRLFENFLAGQEREVNLAAYRHSEITLALHKAVYESRFQGRKLRLPFEDGSESFFPVGALREQGEVSLAGFSPLRLGLMSFRHPELDFLVSYYVTRNFELAEQSSMSEQEELSARRTRELFPELPAGENIVLEAYHTRLEPMVVGFYRGVVEALVERRRQGGAGKVTVTSHLFTVTRGGPPYSATSPGARATDYAVGAIWR